MRRIERIGAVIAAEGDATEYAAAATYFGGETLQDEVLQACPRNAREQIHAQN